VRSYYAAGPTKNVSGLWSLAAPGFATHWGIIVGLLLFHLVFQGLGPEKGQATDLGALMAEGHPITVDCKLMTDEGVEQCKVVGYTRYSQDQIVRIARALIAAFGNYHRLFWNCQVYAEILLEIITDGEKLPR